MYKFIIFKIIGVFLVSMLMADSVTPISPVDNKCSGKFLIKKGYSDLSKGFAQAKKRALMDAYQNAVSEGSGVNIEEFTQAKTSGSLSQVYSIITKKAKGFISSYELLSVEKVSKDRVEATIKACVLENSANDFEYENGLRMFVQLLGSPKVLFVLGEEKFGDQKTIKTLQVNNSKNQMTINSKRPKSEQLFVKSSETVLANYFKKFAYDVTTSDDLVSRGLSDEETIKKARTGIGGYAIKLARDIGADIVISGNIIYSLNKKKISNSSGYQTEIIFDAKALMPGSGKILGIYHEKSSNMSLLAGYQTSKEKASRAAILEAAKKLVWDIPKYLINEEREIEIKFKNISYKQLRFVKKHISSLKEVLAIKDSGKWKRIKGKKGDAHILIETSYLGVTVDDILDALAKMKINAEVDEATDYYLEVVITS